MWYGGECLRWIQLLDMNDLRMVAIASTGSVGERMAVSQEKAWQGLRASPAVMAW